MWEMIENLSAWQKYTYAYVGISIIANVFFTFIITVGGVYDLKKLFRALNKEVDEIHKQKNPKEVV